MSGSATGFSESAEHRKVMECQNAKRAPNFAPAEKAHLIGIIANKYSKIIEDKKTDRTSVSDKIRAWKDIEVIFNGTSPTSYYRSWECLKRYYENSKKIVRKIKSKERQETYKTGGGPIPKVKKDEADDILISIINEKTIMGLQNPYDSDNGFISSVAHDDSIEFIIENSQMDHSENHTTEEPEYSNINMKLVGKLIGVEENNMENVRETVCISDNHISKDNWKKYNPDQLRNEISSALSTKNLGQTSLCTMSNHMPKSAGDNDKDNNVTPKKHLNPRRRRPTQTITTLTSSHVAQKYDLLLDRRLVLVEKQIKQIDEETAFHREKQALKIELLKLEVESKKNSLSKSKV